MKKMLTLILALCISFSLCACGNSAPAAGENLSEEERYEIFIEVAKEYGYYDIIAPIIEIYPDGMDDFYSGTQSGTKPAAPVEEPNIDIGNEDPNSAERSIVFDEPVLLYEDERIGVELTSIYQKESQGVMNKHIALKIHNKTDRYWLFHLDGLYLDGEATYHSMIDGNSGPDAGIKQEFRYRIAYNNGAEEKPLDSLEQLLKADMKLSVDLFDKNEEYLEDEFFVRFSYDATDFVS